MQGFEDKQDPREFVECIDDAPTDFRGDAYAQYVLPGGRTFVRVGIAGGNVLIEKPDWFWNGPVPGTKIFHLEPQPVVKKYMTSHLLPVSRRGFNALGADHCNQTTDIIPYRLVEITEETAQGYANNAIDKVTGGNRKNRTTRKKNNKKKHVTKTKKRNGKSVRKSIRKSNKNE